jgi:hypothetical protein
MFNGRWILEVVINNRVTYHMPSELSGSCSSNIWWFKHECLCVKLDMCL